MNRVADRTPVTSSQRVSELVEVRRFEAAIAPYNKRTHATCETHAHDAQRWADKTEKRMCQFVGFVGEPPPGTTDGLDERLELRSTWYRLES